MDKQIFTVVVCVLTAYISSIIFRILAKKYMILDAPGRRKIQKTAVPMLGGMAVYCGFMASLLMSFSAYKAFYGVFIGGTIILLVGLADDIKGLSPHIRLLAQFAASFIVILSGVQFNFIPKGFIGDSIELFLTYLWIMGLTNSINYLDGLDGLAAGTISLSAVFLALISGLSGQFTIAAVFILLSSACLGFLPHNFNQKNKIFLGDAGSTFLGFTIASFAIAGNWAEYHFIRISIPILILGVPIFDMIFTTFMRIKEEKVSNVVEWLKFSGKDHFHHRLVDLGLSPNYAVFYIYVTTIALGVNALIISYSEVKFVGFLAIFQAAIILVLIAILMVVGRKHRSGWSLSE